MCLLLSLLQRGIFLLFLLVANHLVPDALVKFSVPVSTSSFVSSTGKGRRDGNVLSSSYSSLLSNPLTLCHPWIPFCPNRSGRRGSLRPHAGGPGGTLPCTSPIQGRSSAWSPDDYSIFVRTGATSPTHLDFESAPAFSHHECSSSHQERAAHSSPTLLLCICMIREGRCAGQPFSLQSPKAT